MGTTRAVTYVRTALPALTAATTVLGTCGYVTPDERLAGLGTRTLRVWREGDWVVLEDEDLHELSDLGVAGSSLGDVLITYCFDDDIAVVSRFDGGANTASLYLGSGRMPGAGQINAAAVNAFEDLLVRRDDVAHLRKLARRSSDPADRLCSQVVGLFGLTFTEEPATFETLIVAAGSSEPSHAETIVRWRGVSGGSLVGVSGDRLGTMPAFAQFELEGDLPVAARLHVSGSAIDDGIIDIGTVMYVVLGSDRPPPTFVDTDERLVALDLGVYASESPDRPHQGHRPRQRIGIGIEGRFGAIGEGELRLSLAVSDGLVASSSDLHVMSLAAQRAPTRRSSFPERQSTDRGDAMLALRGSEVLVGTLHLERDTDAAWRIDTFREWAGRLGGSTSEPVRLSFVDGVRQLPVSQIGGDGLRWSKIVGRISEGLSCGAVVAGDDGREYEFDVDPDDPAGRGGFDVLQFTLPHTGEEAFAFAQGIIEAACASRGVWQAHLGCYAAQPLFRLRRVYETALGHNRNSARPDARTLLAEPARLIVVEPELYARLDPDVVRELYSHRRVGDLIELVASDWPALHAMERVFEPILRPPRDDDEPSHGLSRSFRWDREQR